ncbi:MAG: T9SS type A sorting domain-containing protein [Bacteroidetes bacterium]|nr:T9SS type A sorting domain-containing protein [Bacteroidota bacterium]
MKSLLRRIFLTLLVGIPLLALSQPFKQKYYDPNVNVNDLIQEADAWFAANGTGPGTGWKGYQRWRYEFERRFYPSGERSSFDARIAVQEYGNFKATQPIAKAAGIVGSWTFRGPFDATNILPPSWAAGLGRIEAVWGGAVTADTVYLGSRSGGFWKTVDGGANWHSTTQELPAMGVVDIEVHPDRRNEVWILTRHAAGYSYGLLKSTDFGETWNSTGLSYTQQQAYAGQFIMATADTFFVTTNGGIQRSTDGGNTWASCYNGNMITMVEHPTNSQILYAFDWGSYNQLRRTTNGGQTWTNQSVPGNSGYPFLATTPAQPNTVYVGSSAGIFRSTDAGLSFTFVAADPTNSGIMTLGVSGMNADEIYAGSLSHYKSTNGGANWSMYSDWINFFGTNYIHADMRVFRTWGNRIFAGTDGFLSYSSDNGQTWSIINQGVGVKEFYRIGCSAMDAEDVVGGSQDNGTSVMQDGVWHEWIGADGMQAHFDYNNPETWFGTIQFGNLQRTMDAGQNANDVSAGTDGSWVTPSVIDPSNENTIFIAYDTIYKSNDNGDHWQMMAGFLSGNFDEIAIAPSDSNVLYISKGSVIRRSTDNGHTWTYINAGLANYFINRIAVHPDDPMKVLVCESGFSNGNKVFYSTNGGTNWTNISGNLPNLPANAVAWAEGPPVRMFVGMDVGVYYADAGTNAWTLYADSLPAVVVNDIEVLNGAGLLRVGTWGRGVWEAPIPGREGMPQIVKVIADPASYGLRPKPGDTVQITAVIRNQGGIQGATLRWGTSIGLINNTVAMAHVQGDTFRGDIPPHPQGTHIYYRITGTAPNGDSARTERLMYLVKEAIPCAATGTQGTTYDFIDTVRVAGLNNVSGQEYYGDFRNIYTDLYRDSSYTLTSWLNYSFALDSMFMWVDWNHDGDFLSNEQVIMSDLDASHKSSGTFTVPHVPMIPDTVLMRIRSVYGTNLVADPCNGYFGEVEDYSMVLRDVTMVGLENAPETGLSIYPNPAADAVKVIWGKELGMATVCLRDLQGRQVLNSLQTETSACQLDLKPISEGMYLIEVVTATSVLRGRILVAR